MNKQYFVSLIGLFSWGISHLSISILPGFLLLQNNALAEIKVAIEEDGDPPNKPGGSRNPCDEAGLDLTPIVINQYNSEANVSSWGKTSAERPSLWVYIPYERDDLARVTISVRTEDEEETIYEERLSPDSLGTTPGIVRLSLKDAEKSLEMGQWYRWYLFLEVYCSENSDRPEQDEINTWIQRQNSDSNQSDFVYDRLAEISAIDDPQVRQNAWIEILRSLGYDAIADEL